MNVKDFFDVKTIFDVKMFFDVKAFFDVKQKIDVKKCSDAGINHGDTMTVNMGDFDVHKVKKHLQEMARERMNRQVFSGVLKHICLVPLTQYTERNREAGADVS